MGDARAVAVRREPLPTTRTKRALKVAGAGVAGGAAAGMLIGGSVGVAAVGTAIGIPLAAIGAAAGLGLAALWNLFFGGGDKKARLFQEELTTVVAENYALRAQLEAARQHVTDAAAKEAQLGRELKQLKATVGRLEEKIAELEGCLEGGAGAAPPMSGWVGTTKAGAAILLDRSCQMNRGDHVLLFLPTIGEYRVFHKSWPGAQLTMLSANDAKPHIKAYKAWLDSPENRDAQKKAIARLVGRGATDPRKNTRGKPQP